jgi:hypothetical protein
MQEAAGSWRGLSSIASTMANRISAVLRTGKKLARERAQSRDADPGLFAGALDKKLVRALVEELLVFH